ncbi:MAG: class I SAM-dependent methyltransferase [Candidatus Binataceae bacterium]
MSDEFATTYYAETFGGERHMRGQQVNASVNLGVLRRLLDLARVRRFLEVGCGYGFLLDGLRARFDIGVQGVELSEQEARFAEEHLGLPVVATSLSRAGLDKASFDIVACFEVIEHVAEPRSFVKELAEYVRPGGKLVIMTDNFESRVCRIMGDTFPKWIPHSHISHFAPRTLIRCIDSTPSLRVVRLVTFTPWELWLLAGAKLLRRRASDSVWNFDHETATEMTRKYRLFQLRRVANSLWSAATLTTRNDGELMFALIEKTSV